MTESLERLNREIKRRKPVPRHDRMPSDTPDGKAQRVRMLEYRDLKRKRAELLRTRAQERAQAVPTTKQVQAPSVRALSDEQRQAFRRDESAKHIDAVPEDVRQSLAEQKAKEDAERKAAVRAYGERSRSRLRLTERFYLLDSPSSR
ncbi:MAG: hypothetical protein H0X25_13805 [Acidobacteriales bacterium]|nr:hypothetical protein [Terriglobales bacterium]